MSKATDTLRFLAIHNSWRRGDETFGTQDPTEIGAAIDDAVNLLRRYDELERENAELRERLHIADAEIDMWASRCASAIWMLPETVTGGQLREAQDKFHRMLHAARKEAQP